MVLIRVRDYRDVAKEIGVFRFARVPRRDEYVRIPAAKLPATKKDKERTVIVKSVIHVAFARGVSAAAGNDEPVVELHVDLTLSR